MTEHSYWPYDEVTLLKSDVASNKVTVKTPWITANVGVPDQFQDDLAQLIKKFENQTLSGHDRDALNWFFQGVSGYPFSYILPELKASETLDHHDLSDESLLDLSLENFLEATTTEDSFDFDIKAIIHSFPRKNWDWDIEAACTFARTSEGIHPESLFSVARRFHLLDLCENSSGRQDFEFIASLTGSEFLQAASMLVRQNHYVTQQCRTAILPALDIAGMARSRVEDFVKQEDGHDRILYTALKSLVLDPESVPVTLNVRVLMHLLKFAARKNFLGFAMAVDCFERSSYEAVDPMAQLLIKGGFEKAARQVNRHMEINDAGEHENVACTFLEYMAPCSNSYAVEALRIAEAITLVMNTIPTAVTNKFR